MQIDFPNGPSLNQVFTSTEAGKSWIWDGTTWKSYTDTASNPFFVPTGSILPYGGASAPSGWLVCDGSAIAIASYPGLYSVISTTYNTSGGLSTPASGFFRVPPLSGRVPVGVGGTAFTARGVTGGSESVILTEAQMPVHTHIQNAHSHVVSDPEHRHGQYVSANPNTGGTANRTDFDADVTGATAYTQGISTEWATTGISINDRTATNQNAGGSGGVTQAHTNLQPYIVLNYIIKT